jgi:hypothetical protein
MFFSGFIRMTVGGVEQRKVGNTGKHRQRQRRLILAPHPPSSAFDGSPLARYVDIHAEKIDEDDEDFLSSGFMPLFTPIENLQL